MSSASGKNAAGGRSLNSWPSTRRLIIPAIAVVSVLCFYALYRHSQGVSGAVTSYAAGESRAAVQSAPVNPQLEGIRNLRQDFIAQLDRNVADRNGEGPRKNQSLAFDTLALLREQQMKVTDPAAQKGLDDFYRLVGRYYDQLARYNSERDDIAEASRRTKSEIDAIQEDPSLTPEDKLARKHDLKNRYFEQAENHGITSHDIEETASLIRNLAEAPAAHN